jgi:hypothetical protein
MQEFTCSRGIIINVLVPITAAIKIMSSSDDDDEHTCCFACKTKFRACDDPYICQNTKYQACNQYFCRCLLHKHQRCRHEDCQNIVCDGCNDGQTGLYACVYCDLTYCNDHFDLIEEKLCGGCTLKMNQQLDDARGFCRTARNVRELREYANVHHISLRGVTKRNDIECEITMGTRLLLIEQYTPSAVQPKGSLSELLRKPVTAYRDKVSVFRNGKDLYTEAEVRTLRDPC